MFSTAANSFHLRILKALYFFLSLKELALFHIACCLWTKCCFHSHHSPLFIFGLLEIVITCRKQFSLDLVTNYSLLSMFGCLKSRATIRRVKVPLGLNGISYQQFWVLIFHFCYCSPPTLLIRVLSMRVISWRVIF